MESVTLWGAFFAGLLSFISPCVLPMLPTFSLILAKEERGKDQNNVQIYKNSVLFLVGFSIMFILMGATASFLGQWLFEYQSFVQKVGAVILIFMGMFMTGIIKFSWLEGEYRPFLKYRFQGSIGVFLLGISFAVGWTPCTGPILATILLYAGTSATVGKGAFLLLIYAIGFSIPFFLLAVLWRNSLLRLKKFYSILPRIQIMAGCFLIILGILNWFDLLKRILGLIWPDFS